MKLRADALFLDFVRTLREGGLAVDPARARTFLEAVAVLGAGAARSVRSAGWAALCTSPDDVFLFDRVFADYFVERSTTTESQSPSEEEGEHEVRDRLSSAATEDLTQDEAAPVPTEDASASEAERLRGRDLAEIDSTQAIRHLAAATYEPPKRRSLRYERASKGRVDARATVRSGLRRHGEVIEISHRRQAKRDRRVYIVVDVSGSMTPYADAMLLFAHRLLMGTPPKSTLEVLSLGTRLTSLTDALRVRDPQVAVARASAAIPDWAGGTRISSGISDLLRRHQHALKGAVVVVISDGWESGNASDLGDQVERLSQNCHRLIWVSPHVGKANYEPIQQGVRALLPHVDDFVDGHTTDALTNLIEVISHA